MPDQPRPQDFKCFCLAGSAGRRQRAPALGTGGVAGTHRLLHGVSGTQLLGLQMALHIGRTHRRLYRLGAVTHDHVDAFSVQGSGGLQHV